MFEIKIKKSLKNLRLIKIIKITILVINVNLYFINILTI